MALKCSATKLPTTMQRVLIKILSLSPANVQPLRLVLQNSEIKIFLLDKVSAWEEVPAIKTSAVRMEDAAMLVLKGTGGRILRVVIRAAEAAYKENKNVPKVKEEAA